MKHSTKNLLCVLCAAAAALCVIFAIFTLTKKQNPSSGSSAASTAPTQSEYGTVDSFDYQNFTYSDGLDANGYRTGITAQDYVTLPDNVAALPIKKADVTPSDSDVQARIDSLLSQYSTTQAVTDRAAQNGDVVNIDYSGTVDGVAFNGGTYQGYDLTLGSGSFIPGFEDQIVGHSAGEEFDVNVTFPTEYQAAELAGKAAVFKIKLHEVKYKELPALDDELAKDCSEYDTLDEFKASIRKNNQEQLDKQDDLAVENALVDQVIESMEGEIPQAMYDARMDEMVNDFAFRVEQQGLRLEDYLKYMGQTMEQFRASFMPQAEKQVKIRLALEAVAAAENIEASEEEVSAEIKRIADQYKMEEDKVRELVNVDDLKKDLAINKAIDFIKSHANIVEKAAEEEKAADAE